MFKPYFSFLPLELTHCSANQKENSLYAVSVSDFPLVPIVAKGRNSALD